MIDIQKHEEDIVNFGAFNYTADTMAVILGVDLALVEKQMSDKGCAFFNLYQKGQLMAEYVIDQKLLQMAKGGDIKALEKLEIRKKIRQSPKR